MDDNSFAALVGKLNQIDSGRKPSEKAFKSKTTDIKEGMKNNNMSSILENLYRDVPFESARTTASDAPFKKGYKPKQLPADYKMPSVGPVLGGDEEEIPTDDYLVGEDSIDFDDIDYDETEIDIKDKGEYDQEGEMAKGQLNRAADAALELQSILDDDENLPEWVQNKITKALDYLDTSRDYMKGELDEAPLAGTQDIKDYQQTGTPGQPNNDPAQTQHSGDEQSWDGVNPTTDQVLSGPINKANKAKQMPEDSINKKRSIMDFIGDVEAKHNEDMLADPVKTFTTDDGKEMKIYRTKDDGYRIKVNGKESKSSFGKLDDAVMACETFVQKSIDYASER
jgi:hypothetical protein